MVFSNLILYLALIQVQYGTNRNTQSSGCTLIVSCVCMCVTWLASGWMGDTPRSRLHILERWEMAGLHSSQDYHFEVRAITINHWEFYQGGLKFMPLLLRAWGKCRKRWMAVLAFGWGYMCWRSALGQGGLSDVYDWLTWCPWKANKCRRLWGTLFHFWQSFGWSGAWRECVCVCVSVTPEGLLSALGHKLSPSVRSFLSMFTVNMP